MSNKKGMKRGEITMKRTIDALLDTLSLLTSIVKYNEIQ